MRNERRTTKYAGVFSLAVTTQAGDDISYYMMYRKNGRLVNEKAGRRSEGWTAAKAAQLRFERIKGDQLTNQERREQERASAYTFSRLWQEYTENRPQTKSLRVDTARFQKHIAPHLGDKTPSQVAPLDIDRLRRKHLWRLKPQTVSHVLKLITRLANFGKKKQLTAGLSFSVELPKLDNQLTEFLKDDEVVRLIKACAAFPDRQTADMVLLAQATGLRRGELYKLEWADLDFARGRIYVTHGPKGGKSEWRPLLNTAARKILQAHPKREGCAYVFYHADGAPYTEGRHNHRQLRELYRQAGIAGVRPLHGLRHTYASLAIEEGADLYVVQKLLGHKSPSVTQRYSHLRDEMLRRASELVSARLDTNMTTEKGATDAKAKS